MKKIVIEKIVSLAALADKAGKPNISAKLDKLAERLIVKAEMAATVSAAPEMTKEQKVERMHTAINAMLKGQADSYVAKYNTDAGLPKEMKIAMTRQLKNSELVSFIKMMGFDYKTWNQMWTTMGDFNSKFMRAMKNSRHPFVIGPDFMKSPAKPSVDIGEPTIKEPQTTQSEITATPPAKPANPAAIAPVKPGTAPLQPIPTFQTKPVLPPSDWTTRK